MVVFPENLYADVRVEVTYETSITYKKSVLEEQKIRKHQGAFLRVFDGSRWYYASTTDLDNIQKSLDELASMATPNTSIHDNLIVDKFEINTDTCLNYANEALFRVPTEEKRKLIEGYLVHFKVPEISHFTAQYVDSYIEKQIISSKGSHVHFDKQTCGVRFNIDLAINTEKDSMSLSKAGINFSDICACDDFIASEIHKNIEFLRHAKPVVPGIYTVLLSPLAAGVFTHESFGHKSESDFMVGDETMKAEWALGKKVGSDILTIIDNGEFTGNGYVPYDDEGTKGRKNYIITDGILTGRLHSNATAAILEEPLTGNARSMNFEFEPIVRMTTTYIERGNRPLADIIAEMPQGIFVDNIKHGSGMSTFTIAPSRAYLIENGKITTPVKISVVTGNVFETLAEVDALSEEFELLSFVGGGCGKMEQWPLPVGFGGPYTRVRKLNVQ